MTYPTGPRYPDDVRIRKTTLQSMVLRYPEAVKALPDPGQRGRGGRGPPEPYGLRLSPRNLVAR